MDLNIYPKQQVATIAYITALYLCWHCALCE